MFIISFLSKLDNKPDYAFGHFQLRQIVPVGRLRQDELRQDELQGVHTVQTLCLRR